MPEYTMLADFIRVYMSSLKHMETMLSQPMREYGLSFEQWLIMAAIARSETPLTLTEIAAERDVTKGAVGRQLKPMLALDFVVQTPDENDRRRILLSLTPEGQRIEAELTKRVRARGKAWIEAFGLEESRDLLKDIHRFDELIMKPALNGKNIEKS